jgi:hypothetical protein
MSVSVSFDVGSDVKTGNDLKSYDWGRLIEMRLAQQYPDLNIKFENKTGQTLTFTMGFENRPTSESDIRSRLFSFMQYYPAMKIGNLEIKLESKYGEIRYDDL